MRLLSAYLGRELIWGVGLTMMSLVAIAYFVTFSGEMGNIGQFDFTTNTALIYVLLKMPKIVQEMFPIAVLIGGLFAFGGLASTNELTIMRATGVPMLGLVWRLRKMAVFVLVVAVINMEWVVPFSEKNARVIKAVALHESVLEFSGNAFWLRDGDYFVRMDNVEADGTVVGVQWMKIPEHGRLEEVSFAEKAYHYSGVWNMEQVRINHIQEKQVDVASKPKLQHKSEISKDFVRLASRNPEDLSTPDLLAYSRFLERSGLDSSRYWHTFWTRIAAPFGLVVMLIMAIPFSVSGGRSLAASRRVVIGIFIGVAYYLMNKVLLNTGEIYQFNPVLTVFAVPLLFLSTALLLIRQRGL